MLSQTKGRVCHGGIGFFNFKKAAPKFTKTIIELMSK